MTAEPPAVTAESAEATAESAAITAAGGTDVAAVMAGLVTVTLWGSAFVGIRAAGEAFSPGALGLACSW